MLTIIMLACSSSTPNPNVYLSEEITSEWEYEVVQLDDSWVVNIAMDRDLVEGEAISAILDRETSYGHSSWPGVCVHLPLRGNEAKLVDKWNKENKKTIPLEQNLYRIQCVLGAVGDVMPDNVYILRAI